MLELRAIHKTYTIGANRLHVLKGIDLTIGLAPKAEMVSIMGSSGSGKSTLLNVIGLLDAFDEGEYLFDGDVMKGLSERRSAVYRGKLIGFVFQSFHLIAFKTAVENVALPLYYQNVGRRERNELAMEALERVGLGPWAEHRPRELSGGQQQRVAIARALVTRPKLILADEPTGALDSATSFEVMEVLRSVHRDGVSVVIVTHEHDIAARTDRVIHLVDGTIASDASPHSLGLVAAAAPSAQPEKSTPAAVPAGVGA